MKKLLCIMLVMLSVAGCQKQDVPPTETDTKIEVLEQGKGETVGITLDELNEKLKNKESFVMMFSETYCRGCMSFFMANDKITQEYGIKLWNVTLDKEERTPQENLEIIHKNFPEFESTPSIYCVVNGKVQDSLIGLEVGSITNEVYLDFLTRNNIVEKKVE